jgi:hypothetical protein
MERLRNTTITAEPDMARICLLLSYWAPRQADEDPEVNNRWVDQAMYHTRIALSKFSVNTDLLKYRLKILYWTCIIRNTLLSIVLRRPHRLRPIKSELYKPDEVLLNFGNEALNPRLQDKRFQMHVFIWTCKICKILNAAITSLEQAGPLGDWSTERPASIAVDDKDEISRSSGLSMQSLQAYSIRGYECQLQDLSVEYEKLLSGMSRGKSTVTDTQDFPETGSLSSLYMNRIITS